ncbi:type 1 glutamine amidotransferase domain-containing protein [Cystobacter fuscus]|uniref:type 1 glutamine amidotransferase domain-containing protein n=1 Tax=Cystobacter fuscus TaxID=43 RepID=UPI001FE1AEE5|nr:type 1 glutamine amidotransferase domain-containing protein [Cystobacter fuscus]
MQRGAALSCWGQHGGCSGGSKPAARPCYWEQEPWGLSTRIPGPSTSFDTVFYPGGHGPLWDLAEDQKSINLVESFLAAGKPVALVCHAPGVLRHTKTPDGRPLVEGKNVTGFANSEEEGVGLTHVVPFLVEDELKAKGGIYSRGPDWGSYVIQDGLLITGQNPGSSPATARALFDAVKVAA